MDKDNTILLADALYLAFWVYMSFSNIRFLKKERGLWRGFATLFVLFFALLSLIDVSYDLDHSILPSLGNVKEFTCAVGSQYFFSRPWA